MRQRIDSIDLVRGLVIVLMAIDHVRDFFAPAAFAPEDLSQASAPLFLTRWITHFCAPVFVLLAGTAVALWEARGRTRREVSRFLVTRGLWLIVLELVVVNLSWAQFYYGGFVFVQVIWAIGWSFIVLAGLIWLPRWAIGAFAVILIVGHNLLDGIRAQDLGSWDLLWAVLHQQYWKQYDPIALLVIYPLIPWLGVMAFGYLLGDLYLGDAKARKRWLLRAGVAMTVAFVVIRGLNGYGDPRPWEMSDRAGLFTVLSFLNTTKYPASLDFLLMTLGPALCLLAVADRFKGPVARALVVFGRVPLFLYLIHLPVIHLAAIAWSLAMYGQSGWWLTGSFPEGYETSLVLLYVVWFLVVLALLPLCRWFGYLKRRSASPWMSYL